MLKNSYITNNEFHLFLLGDVDSYNGDDLAREIFHAPEDVEKIVLHINSGGGNIVNGLSLVGAIYDSKKTVETINEGAALSMAAIIFVAGHKRRMRDYAILMLHNPSIWGNEPDDFPEESKERRALENLKNTLVKILETNSNLDKEKLNELLNEETWIDAETAKKYGFVDEIIVEKGEKPSVGNSLNVSEFISACSAKIEQNVIPKLNIEPKTQIIKNKVTMLEKIRDALGLPSNTDDIEVLLKVQNLAKESKSLKEDFENSLQDAKAKAKSLANELTEVKAQLSETSSKLTEKEEEVKKLKNSLQEYVNSYASSLVEQAFNQGKIKEEAKEQMLEFAKSNPEGFKNFIEAIPERPKIESVSKEIANNFKEEKSSFEDRSDWTFDDWSKEDPEGLRKMKQEEPEKFEKLLNSAISE